MKEKFISEETVLEEVKKGVAETLNRDKASIGPEDSLMKDLGAESLDFLDITYRLEQTFGIKMARHFVLEHVEEMFGEGSAIDENGQLTDKAVELLKIRAGGDLPAEIHAGMDMDEVPTLVTVKTMTMGVMDILDSLPGACAACGNSAWKTENGVRIVCGSCGANATFDNGDDLMKAWLSKVQEEKKLF
ncbi:MAG TPA: phosphopantetheine-binding protein [Thermodesulfovibrionales bacterium]|jgi:acyl carrier protein|nr:phosphopantetheine-binding protein [Thermodesulfovibrionales bacterium]